MGRWGPDRHGRGRPEAVPDRGAGAEIKIPWISDWKERTYARLSRWLGPRGGLLAFAILAIAVPFLWSNWDDIRGWPYVRDVVARFSAPGIPTVDASSYSVLVAKLGGDPDGAVESLVLESLAEVPGVHVYRLGRHISEGGAYNAVQVGQATEIARRYLRESGARILIWGTVVAIDGRSVIKLRWATTEPVPGVIDFGRYSPSATNDLPAGFWSDLSIVMSLVLANEAATLEAYRGRYAADRLAPFVAKVRALVAAAEQDTGRWRGEMRSRTKSILADALVTLGDQAGDSHVLEEAIALYRDLQASIDRGANPLLWASLTSDLANALRLLGARDDSGTRLQESVDAYQQALQERKREIVPQDWATSVNGLGNALRTIGMRQRSIPHLHLAIDAYRNALTVRTPQAVPMSWAATQNNLGNALRALGAQRNDQSYLLEAVAAYESALSIRRRETAPLDWAATQNNLGNALRVLGTLQGEMSRLNASLAAYQRALEERTRDRVPLRWAATQHNIGLTLLAQARLENSRLHVQRAIVAFEKALEERTKERAAAASRDTERRLRKALELLREFETRDRSESDA